MLIRIFDIIGTKSGMHYYLDSFAFFLQKHRLTPIICSNYSNNGSSFFPNIYNKGIFAGSILLTYSLIKYLIFSSKKKSISILFYYGTFVDLLFLILCFRNKKVYIDIHELILLDNKSYILKKITFLFFRMSVNKIIYHSVATKEKLITIGSKSELIYFPHISYNLDSLYNIDLVGSDVKNSILPGVVNCLFFGNIRESKGISDLISLIQYLESLNEVKYSINIIIAGSDIFGILDRPKDIPIKFGKLILRNINDDEMKYLFLKSDIILLPYKKVSQSGIMEMAINYMKPMLTSDLKYFSEIFKKYPSFGLSVNTENEVVFSSKILDLYKLFNRVNFEKDRSRYYVDNYNNELTNSLLCFQESNY